MKNWIANKIIKLIGLEESLKQVKDLCFDNRNRFNSECCDLRSKISATQKYLKIAVDVHTRPESENWAVICIAGKPEYVKFAKFKNNDMREIKQFLRSFEYANITSDAPLGFKDLMY